jgi:peptidoglycan/LPS O-acetylase OafA/YrhL
MHPDQGRAGLIKPLTSIRFFAALYVVVYHSGSQFAMMRPEIPGVIKTFLLNGYVGVTFFFALSGFILHHTYRGKLAEPGKLKGFAVARFARIYPVYLLATVAMVPFTPSFGGWADVPQFLGLHLWITTPVPLFGGWNGPAWTVSVEIFFYFCFPWLSALATRLGSRSILVILAFLLLFTLVTASPTFVSTHPARFEWLRWVPTPLVRIPEFIIGLLVAEWHARREGKRFPLPSWVVALGLIIVLALSNEAWVGTAVTLLTATMVAAIAADQGSLFARMLQQRWLVLLGAASYSLYLLQQPIHFTSVALLGTQKAMLVLQYPAMLGGSLLVFLFFEEPVREWIRTRVRMKPSVIEQVTDHPV